MNNIKYYLSFDCATKTFAYILVKINFNYLYADTNELRTVCNYISNQIKEGKITEDIINILHKLDNNTKNAIQFIKGECIDLIPNIANKDIDTVERIKIVSKYVKKNIYPLITDINPDQLSILVEFQMSHNTQSKVVSIALLTLFSDYEIHLVNPSLKNKLYFTTEGKYCHFIEKYKNSYDANKKHALYNFKEFERIFNQSLTCSDKLKGHIADAFMQILGLIMYPMNNNERTK